MVYGYTALATTRACGGIQHDRVNAEHWWTCDTKTSLRGRVPWHPGISRPLRAWFEPIGLVIHLVGTLPCFYASESFCLLGESMNSPTAECVYWS
ncbi:hypothetical protein BDN67DRAFT_830598 [Paxillus ammoniavirescens]|nr:hypothetical protein BDN67DRAFT_830598 [Paxillus ammoniavirescens]